MMIKKKDYFNLKHNIRNMCYASAMDLCKEVGLNEYETRLITHINRDNTRTQMCLDIGCCPSKISKDLKRIFTKIDNHLKRS